MDNVTLKKKLSTYLSSGGQLRNVSDDVLYEVLIAWENWTGSGVEFYRSLGFTQKQMACLLGKAKRMKREGNFGSAEFKAVRIEGQSSVVVGDGGPCPVVEVVCSNGQLIRFSGVDILVDYLKKSA